MTRADFSGRYIHYGIREFGMAAAMNGMALHGGVIPYGGTFLVFSDYCRAAIRLSALQRARVIYVLTHDSIGLGEDGPTHQPVEQLMSLRMIPNLAVFRPADAIETAECWSLALARTDGPSVLALSRQNLPSLGARPDMLCARGAWRVAAAVARRRVVLVATGSEVSVARDARELLEREHVGADLVSMPGWMAFEAEDTSYRHDLLPDDALIVSVEAGVTLGWERWTGSNGLRIGLDCWGASAPAGDLFRHFGFTGERIAAAVMERLREKGARSA
jgi:transketolase